MAPRRKWDVERLELAVRDAFVTAEDLQWQSHDPFDLLAAPLLSPLQRWSRALAQVAVQVGKRSGEGLRSTLRVPRHEEPKAIADYLRAAALLTSRGRSWPERFLEPLTKRLVLSGRLSGGQYGWGLGFPYTSRFVNAPAGTPNAYTTMAVTDALLDAGELLGENYSLDAVRGACSFVVDTLGAFEYGGRRWLRYWPGREDRIINIQATAASLLTRAAVRLGDAKLSRVADEATATTLGTQRPNGSWPYSDDPRGSFVDGFHTGFVLQGLAEYAERRQPTDPAVASAVDAGRRYFTEQLLTPDGLPRGFAGGKVSLDPQNVAQCVQTLTICATDDVDQSAGIRAWERAAELGRSPLRPATGLVSLRWSLGPGALAAAYLVSRSAAQAAGIA